MNTPYELSFVNQIFGLGCLAIGLWMLIDKKIYEPLEIFRRKPDDKHLLAVPVLLLIAGLIIIGMGILAMLGYIKNSRRLLTIVSLSLYILIYLS